MSDARILDRGYRRYEGERSGVGGAMASVARHTVRSILGLGRSARHKVFPVIVLVVAAIPAIVFLGVSILLGNEIGDGIRPEYWELFGFSFLATIVFVALVAPEAIVRDRRDGMLSLYLSTPLSKASYLVAKAVAVFGTMALIVIAPPLLALLGFTFQNLGPDGFVNWIGTLAGIALAGVAICALYTAVTLGVSSLTDRRAFASIAVVFVTLGLSIVAAALDAAGLSDWWQLLDPLAVAFEIAPRVFGDRTDELRGLDTWAVLVGYFGWTTSGSGLLIYRYRRLAVV